MNTNLLDLNNNILNIIGGYVKRDNERRIDKEDSFEVTDLFIKHLKENNKFNKYEIMTCFTVICLKMVVQKKKLKNMLKQEN
jgi:hypothetical protein